MYLGIDIGTSKAAAVVVDASGSVHASTARPYPIAFIIPPGSHEQNCESLLEEAWLAVKQLPSDLRGEVRGIGITGQMHGMVCCDAGANPTGPLITWQDQRALEDRSFLPALIAAAERPLASGFGTVSLAWLIVKGQLPDGTRQAATIADLAVARLCGNSRLVMDPTNAASWGLFDLASCDWDWRGLERAGIPYSLLPPLMPSGGLAGTLRPDWASNLGLPPSIPVSVALGDNQASMVATLRDLESEMALTLGTGGQLSAVLPPNADVRLPSRDDRWELRPFPRGRFAVVAASLAGGSAWRWLADTASRVLDDLGIETVPKDRLFRKINDLGLEAHDGCGLSVSPHFLGERFAPHLRTSVSGIDPCNFRLGPLARELAWSIIRNLSSMLPASASAGRTAVVGSGNALRRNPLLRAAAQDVLQLPLRLPEACEEAAVGAASIAATRDAPSRATRVHQDENAI